MKKMAIVILNYKNWKDTVECISSLEKQINKNFDIVIVDNFSENQSYETLTSLYKNKEKIIVLKTKKNLGYAMGNNLGIKYAIEELGYFNVLLVNNDTIFNDSNFTNYLLNLKIDKDIGAIGPKIIGSDCENQNPVYVKIGLKSILKSLFVLYLRKFGMSKMIEVNGNRKKRKDKKDMTSSFILHGSAIYLTENYLNISKGLYPETFLYYEENILAMIIEKMNLKMKYLDDIHIYHKEDQSSLLSFNNEDKIKNKYELNSVKIALKVNFTKINTLIKDINY